jgi:Tol biopolymer transport system component
MRDTRALTTHAKLVALGAIAALVVLPSLWFWRASWNRTNEPAASNLTAESNASSWSNATVSRFTDKPGAELFPNFAPDGKSVIYAGDASGNRDIYLQRTGGANPLNLTPDSLLEDTQPAFSPDGERIIFRSARDGGGIFVMGATGESVRRVADFGFNPVWSPDGRHILVATDNVQAPDNRGVIPSQLWRVEVDTGARRLITEGDAVQPSWSPHNHRIAYWSLSKGGGQRDIWTITVDGGAAIKVTDDAAVDWNPVWSPDGKHLYFISDRSGSMNLWRVSLDEQTGASARRARTRHHAVVLQPTHQLLRRRAAYGIHTGRERSQHPPSRFHPTTGRIEGEFTQVTSGAKHVVTPSLSPDGKWFAYSSQGEKQEDIFIVNRDGTLARHVTNDTSQRPQPARLTLTASASRFIPTARENTKRGSSTATAASCGN